MYVCLHRPSKASAVNTGSVNMQSTRIDGRLFLLSSFVLFYYLTASCAVLYCCLDNEIKMCKIHCLNIST